MRKIIILFTALIVVGCKGELLPLLPDADQTVNDIDTAIFNDLNSETDDDVEDGSQNDDLMPEIETDTDDADVVVDEDVAPEMISSLLVTTIKGYDVPYSGKVYELDELNLDLIAQSSDDLLFGSETGSDAALAVFDNIFSVLTRNNGKNIYFFKDESENIMTFDLYTETSENYLNYQDMVYNNIKDEYVISAHGIDELVIFKEGVFTRQKFTDDVGVSPIKMRTIGEKIYINLQYLDDQWNSQKGVIAVVDMNDYSTEYIDLGVKNPGGKIEYNPNFDKGHIYTTCSGSWAKRDGAIVRVDLKTHKVEKVISESDEEGSLLDVDLVDVSITDSGDFYIVVSDNNDNWVNKLYKFDIKEGKVTELDTGVNAFAANPVDYSSTADTVYYFCDYEEKTFLKAKSVESGDVKSYELDAGPASVKIWSRFK